MMLFKKAKWAQFPKQQKALSYFVWLKKTSLRCAYKSQILFHFHDAWHCIVLWLAKADKRQILLEADYL